MTCNRNAAASIEAGQEAGLPEIEAVWAANRDHPQYCPTCRAFLRADGGCNQCEGAGGYSAGQPGPARRIIDGRSFTGAVATMPPPSPLSVATIQEQFKELLIKYEAKEEYESDRDFYDRQMRETVKRLLTSYPSVDGQEVELRFGLTAQDIEFWRDMQPGIQSAKDGAYRAAAKGHK